MRIKANQEEATKVSFVTVDNKRVERVYEVDDDEGWVDVLLPKLPKDTLEANPTEAFDETIIDVGECDWEIKRLKGQVVIHFNE